MLHSFFDNKSGRFNGVILEFSKFIKSEAIGKKWAGQREITRLKFRVEYLLQTNETVCKHPHKRSSAVPDNQTL